MDNKKILDLLLEKVPKDSVLENEPMKKHTTFRIGGNADLFVKGKSLEIIKNTLKIATENNIPLTIIGNGSNLLVRDNGIRGIVLKVCTNNCKIDKKDDHAIVIVDSGMLNAKLAQILLENEITGYEFAAGIPGTIGGAVRMNAGAYGGEMKDVVKDVTFIDLQDNNKIKTLPNSELDFTYRNSLFASKKVIILSAKLMFNYGKKKEIKQKMDENAASRKSKQPLEYPSAGSTFKRGEDFITAKVIDECGLKGTKVGDAQISEKHAGFVINLGEASAKDVLQLVKQVQEEVLEKEGKNIKLEIEILGD